MRQTRKEELLRSFPEVPEYIMRRMKNGNFSANFAVFLTRGEELYARCFHRYYGGELAERQRYVFAPDGAVRYGKDNGHPWKARTEFREPVFCQSCYGFNFDNSYRIMNETAIEQSCMKYCSYNLYDGGLMMEYLRLYCQHPNVEYLMKAGYGNLLGERCVGYWGRRVHIAPDSNINWKSNNLLKMLRLSRDEFKFLHGRETDYEVYMIWRREYPKHKPAELMELARQFHYEVGTARSFADATGLSPLRLVRYLRELEITNSDYHDYIRQCRQLKYDLHDTAISMPHDFMEMHARLSLLIVFEKNKAAEQEFIKNMECREQLGFSFGGLFIRQPKDVMEIISEGKLLHHCVGGYADRHANGKLHIMFIRTAEKPDVPFYTVEVDLLGNIVQVRGLRNCKTTPEVDAFMEEYKKHLAAVFGKKQKRRKTA